MIVGCAKKLNFDLLAPYLGTYTPEVYLDGLSEYNSHVKASEEFRRTYKESPNVIVLDKEVLDCNYNFHEGESMPVMENTEKSVTVKAYKGKKILKLEDNKYVYFDNVKYVKIDESTSMQDQVISNYLINHILPQEELSNGENTFYVSDGKIYYNGEQYEYGVSLVFEGHKYDHIESVESHVTKYVEVLDGKLNIYSALTQDMEEEVDWDNYVEYDLECSFVY